MKLKWAKIFDSLKLITNRATEYFPIFIVRKSTKKMDWKLGVVSLSKTTYINYIYYHGR